MEDQFSRTKNLIGQENLDILKSKKVMVIGIGGVGGFVCEALARAGIQDFILIDNDVVSVSNINRQIIALNSTIGKAKVDVMKARILDINPNAKVETKQEFVTPDTIDVTNYDVDYVISSRKC